MANTYAAALIVDRLAEEAVTTLGNRLAPLRAFTRDFGTSVYMPRQKVQIVSTATTSTAADNPSDYESGDTTSTAIEVTVNECNASFHVGSQGFMQGERLERIARANLNDLGDHIWDKCATLFRKAAGYSTNTVITAGAETAFDATDRASAYGSIAKGYERHLILNGTAYATNAPTDKNGFQLSQEGAFGWDGIHLATKWDASSIESNIYGVAATPNAIAVCSGLPNIPGSVANQLDSVSTVDIPGLDLTIQVCVWGSTATREQWMSYGVMFGAQVSDGSAYTCIVSS